jgi:hypothetical protein
MAISIHCEGFGADCLAVALAEIQDSSLMICHTTSCGAIFKDLQVVVVVVVLLLVPEIFQCMLCHIFQQNLGTPLPLFLSGICGRRNQSQFHLLEQSKSIGCPESWDACQPASTNDKFSEVSSCMLCYAKQHGATAAVTHPSKCCSKELLNGRVGRYNEQQRTTRHH